METYIVQKIRAANTKTMENKVRLYFLAFYEKRLPHALFHDGFRVSAERKKSQSICYKLFSFYSLTFFAQTLRRFSWNNFEWTYLEKKFFVYIDKLYRGAN